MKPHNHQKLPWYCLELQNQVNDQIDFLFVKEGFQFLCIFFYRLNYIKSI